jgi:hypothetical protein
MLASPVARESRHRVGGLEALLPLVAPTLLRARTFQNALRPIRHPCRFESSATQIRCLVDAKHSELRFRALLTEEACDVQLARG